MTLPAEASQLAGSYSPLLTSAHGPGNYCGQSALARRLKLNLVKLAEIRYNWIEAGTANSYYPSAMRLTPQNSPLRDPYAG